WNSADIWGRIVSGYVTRDGLKTVPYRTTAIPGLQAVPIALRRGRGKRYAVSLVDTTSVPAGSKATPTSPGPASTSSGAPLGGTRYSPLDPASASTTNSVPFGSNASPCGRPKLAAVGVTAPP